jgi:ankyrin repeat protein
LELLLGLGADPNQHLTWGNVDWTPLAIAVLQDNPAAVRTLVEHGADPNARWCVSVDKDASRRTRGAACNPNNGFTPLMYAASLGYRPIETLLLKLGADAALRDCQGETAADYGAKRPNRER